MALVDSYSESNQSYDMNIYLYPGIGQAFTTIATHTLVSAKFYIKKEGSPTGSATCALYAATGTVGTDAEPTGAILASGTFNVADLSTSYALVEITFSSPYLASAGDYCVVIEYSGGDSSNLIKVGVDNTSPTHDGNSCYKSAGNWTGLSSYDTCFYIYNDVSDGTNMKINIGDAWKDVSELKINIGDTWKAVAEIKQNIGDVWKVVF